MHALGALRNADAMTADCGVLALLKNLLIAKFLVIQDSSVQTP